MENSEIYYIFHGLIEYIFFNYGIDIADPSLSHYVDLMVDFA